MSKDQQRKCPDCAGYDLGSIFEKGNGRCRHCRGEGRITDIGDVITGLAGFNNSHDCERCYGTSQCQTCGGTGYQYYTDYGSNYDIDNDEDYSYNDDHVNNNDYSDYSGYSSSSSESYSPSSSSSSSDKQEATTTTVVTTLLGIIGFLGACNDYTTAFGDPNGVTNAINSKYFGIFLFLDLAIYPFIGVVIGWILVKIIFYFKNS